jgi:hypothetical protein
MPLRLMEEAEMNGSSFVNRKWRPVLLYGALIVVASTAPAVYAQGPGGPNGVDIKIRAQNRSTTDHPFCGTGGGMVGDKLDVDAFMDTNGVVTGTARFEDANGAVTVININRMFAFTICSGSLSGYCGGILVQNNANQNTIPIWFNDFFPNSFGFNPVLLNVELPRGCSNTKATFTPGLDKVTMEIKFR